MAETPDSSPPEPRTISEGLAQYIASGKAWQHVQEGFSGQGTPFLDLQGFKQRESRKLHKDFKPKKFTHGIEATPGHGQQISQGELHQRSTPSEEMKAKWALEQKMLLDSTAEDEEQAKRMCIWCGKLCDDLEALDLHEAECEP